MPGYIGEFEIVDDHRAGKVVVQLLGESHRGEPRRGSGWGGAHARAAGGARQIPQLD